MSYFPWLPSLPTLTTLHNLTTYTPQFTSPLPFLLLSQPSHVPPHHTHLALTSTPPSLLSPLTLIPTLSLHLPLTPTTLNSSEYPACAAMTTGYVFRVENEAMVWFLQQVSETGALTYLRVESKEFEPRGMQFLYSVAAWNVGLVAVVMGGGRKADWLREHVAVLVGCGLLFVARVLSVWCVGGRLEGRGWKGMREEGVRGSLLVLLSRDRWVRLDGMVDDLKAVTSGGWMMEETPEEVVIWQLACLLVWLGIIVLCSATWMEQVIIVGLAVLNHMVMSWQMRSTRIRRIGMTINETAIAIDESKGEDGVKDYERRTAMADELIKEFGRRDWAEQLGLVRPTSGKIHNLTM